MTKSISVCTSFAVLLVAGVVRGTPQDVESRPHLADAGDTLVYGVLQDADGLLPIVGQSVTGSTVFDLVTPVLTQSDFKNGRIVYEPGLATSWEWNADHTQLTYKLRDDVYWDDKPHTRVTAEDVRFTYELIGDPKVFSPRVSYLDRLDPKEPVTVLAEDLVRFNFRYAYNEQNMMAHAGFNVAPKHLLENAARDKLRSNPLNIRKAVGAGPFRMLKWEPKKQITIVRNKHCRIAPVPYIRRIVFKVIPEYQTLLTELRKGSIDMAESIQEKDIADAQKWGTVKLYKRGYRFLDYVAWNAENPLFADRAVRRALTMAIDIDRMIKNLLTFAGETHGTQAYSTFTPELTDFKDEDIQLLPFDPAQAKKILAAKGWVDSDGDGWLDKDGKRFEFTLLTNTGNPRRKDACELIQSDLKKIGIKANNELREGVLFFELLRKKKYEAALAGWSAGLFPDPSDVWVSATEEDPRPFNFTGYSNPTVDALIKKGLKTAVLADEAAIWKKVNRLIYEDQPYTFLFWKSAVMPVHKRFRGIKPNVLSTLHKVWDWWVPKSEHKYKY